MQVVNPKELGLFVRDVRLRRQLTQTALARKTGTTQTWVSEFERGKPRAEVALVFRLLRALDVTMDLQAWPEDAASSRGTRNETPEDNDGGQGIDIDSIVER